MTDELMALADRVEALTGPCRETDVAVSKAVGRHIGIRKYTASLDAAMALVPDGHVMSLNSTSDDEKRRYRGDVPIADWVAMLIKQEHCGYKIDFRGHCRHGYAATPALALTAAALRAIAADQP